MQTDDFEPSHGTQRVNAANANAYSMVASAQANKFLMIAIIVNSALYLTAVFVAALTYGDRDAMIAAILTMGLCYVSPTLQLFGPKAYHAATIVTGLSIIFGIFAGVSLIL